MGTHSFIRFHSTNSCVNKSARAIRKEFLDYFTEGLGHTVVRSSPVLPVSDGTVAFVNAGMNQFKGVFLDYYNPPAAKVVNSQKCIRVGGKHNDLNAVGRDTYHHTFFEMLGNWSFGDYFKEKACRYAWDLLTGRYGIKKEFLYVTYFGGDEKLGLKPDLESRDIWLSLGIPKDRVLPFGAKENFWEMGPVGPCGPCTEIHVDSAKQSFSRSSKVNQGCADLTELWNIVFIQYERLPDDSIKPLSRHHVDTGMGFERLVALMQGKRSNYDTDLFEPFFRKIQKLTNAPEYGGMFSNDEEDKVDRGYRILADHARMIAVALADGVLPEENHKLRRILRRAIDTGRDVFKRKEILPELALVVAESLGEIYPEIESNLGKVQRIIQFEEDLLERLKSTCGKEWENMTKSRPELKAVTNWTAPGLIEGYKYLQSAMGDLRAARALPGNVALKLYETYGLNPETITELAAVEGISFDESALEKELEKLARRSQMGLKGRADVVSAESLERLERNSVPRTDDSLKYRYTADGYGYDFPVARSELLGVIVNGDLALSVETKDLSNDEDTIAVILDKTPCFSFEGGQVSDRGFIRMKGATFNVNLVRKVNGYVLHLGSFAKDSIVTGSRLKAGDECEVRIDPETRIAAMRHHTAVHLLNAALKEVVDAACQKSSAASDDGLRFQYNSFGEKLSVQQMAETEGRMNVAIEAGIPVSTKILNSLELLAEDGVTLIPGEIYPHTGIRLVEIRGPGIQSKEACCGTHVHNTRMLQHVCLTSHSSKSQTCRVIKAIAGPRALAMKRAYEEVSKRILRLEDGVRDRSVGYDALETIVSGMKKELSESAELSYVDRTVSLERLRDLSRSAWRTEKKVERDSIIAEIRNVADSSGRPFVVHSCGAFRHHSLNEVTSLYPKVPIMIILRDQEAVKAQCSVPKEMVSDTFTAANWMKPVLELFDGQQIPIKNCDPKVGVNMRLVNVPKESVESLIQRAIVESTKFAAAHLGIAEVKGASR